MKLSFVTLFYTHINSFDPSKLNPLALIPISPCWFQQLSTLPDTISYNAVELKALPSLCHQEIRYLPRRELFDIRAQLMAEDTGLDQSVTACLSTDDITPNIYEGGFKTWECSLDLASCLTDAVSNLHITTTKSLHVVEVCLNPTSMLPILI